MFPNGPERIIVFKTVAEIVHDVAPTTGDDDDATSDAARARAHESPRNHAPRRRPSTTTHEAMRLVVARRTATTRRDASLVARASSPSLDAGRAPSATPLRAAGRRPRGRARSRRDSLDRDSRPRGRRLVMAWENIPTKARREGISPRARFVLCVGGVF